MKIIFACCFFVTLLAPSVHAKGLSDEEKAITAWIASHMPEALADLERTVNINSGTMNHEGVKKVGKVFQEMFNALEFQTRWISLPVEMNRAGHLMAEKTGSKGKKILMIGHLDTVFEKDSPFQTYERKGDIAVGPGVADMKSGNLIIVYALKALQSVNGLKDITLRVILTGDEEHTGRPQTVSRKELIEAAQKSDIALAFEGGIKDLKKVAAARRGFTGWVLNVTGKPGHSSQIFTENAGMGAIYETARILNAFQDKLKKEKYLTFNPGLILGGTEVEFLPDLSKGTAFGKSNVIAKTATVLGDLRAISEGQREHAKRTMQTIVSNNFPQTSATLEFTDSAPPMFPSKGNMQLVKTISEVSMDLGQGSVQAQDPSERGAADASYVAPYVTVVDGLGAEGYEEHSAKEYLNLKSLQPAIERTAVLLYRLTH